MRSFAYRAFASPVDAPPSQSASSSGPGAPELGDAELIRRVQAGERELFGELHVRHHQRVHRFVARSIFQAETAQDLAGEVWLRAYNAVDRFETRSDEAVLAWLLRIAANLITDHRRRLRPEPDELNEDTEVTHPGLCLPATETLFWNRERNRAVHEAFATLSPADQQILSLAYGEGLSCGQVAAALNKASVSAVTSHLHRAVRHLRARLESAGWGNEPDASDRDAESAPIARTPRRSPSVPSARRRAAR